MPTILAGTAVTLTDAQVAGDVSVSPGSDLTQTRSTISGDSHVDDSEAAAARAEFDAAFSQLAARAASRELVGTLAGIQLGPGVYRFSAAATLTGELTLDGPGERLFLVGAALTASSFNVALRGGARAQDVTWRVMAAATLTDCQMAGSILAGAAATVTRGSLEGDLWARGAVTVTGGRIGA